MQLNRLNTFGIILGHLIVCESFGGSPFVKVLVGRLNLVSQLFGITVRRLSLVIALLSIHFDSSFVFFLHWFTV